MTAASVDASDSIAPVGLAVAVGRAAVTRPDRIDEDEVGEVQPRAVVGGERHRLRRADAGRADGQPPRADRPDVQVGRGRAWAAVDREGHGPFAAGFRRHRVGDVGDLGLQLAGLVDEGQAAGGSGDREGPAVRQGQAVLRGRIGRQAPPLRTARRRPRLRLTMRRVLRADRQGGRDRQGQGERSARESRRGHHHAFLFQRPDSSCCQ